MTASEKKQFHKLAQGYGMTKNELFSSMLLAEISEYNNNHSYGNFIQ